jgi:hypothetical protein
MAKSPPDFVWRILQKYWHLILGAAIGFIAVVWGVAYYTAAPGDTVSVLWGLVEYTKAGPAGGLPADAPMGPGVAPQNESRTLRNVTGQDAPRIEINPAIFVVQGDEFYLDLRYGAVPEVPLDDGINLTDYALEFTFDGGDGRLAQLWYKNQSFANVYSEPWTISFGQPLEFNPRSDSAAVAEFTDFTHIYAVGARVQGGANGLTIATARLIYRNAGQ